jgi:hypothetical protein
MRYLYAVMVLVLSVGLAGCDGARLPKQAIPGTPGTEPEATKVVWPRPPVPKSRTRVYQGRTVEEWAVALNAAEQEEIWRAARALHILGAEGRPHLYRGLESPSAHTRRICLENLAVSDLRCWGDEGRRRLVTLAGDMEDIRIRERASYYLTQWPYVIPAP